ncbi:hypothetical protein G9P44_005221 [Scheffersomyces stipitis]|nr:hypothetical protein G9P44_005221 [Scheffersomyces stipitis]
MYFKLISLLVTLLQVVTSLPHIEAWSGRDCTGHIIVSRWFQDYPGQDVPWPSGTNSVKWVDGIDCMVQLCSGHATGEALTTLECPPGTKPAGEIYEQGGCGNIYWPGVAIQLHPCDLGNPGPGGPLPVDAPLPSDTWVST